MFSVAAAAAAAAGGGGGAEWAFEHIGEVLTFGGFLFPECHLLLHMWQMYL